MRRISQRAHDARVHHNMLGRRLAAALTVALAWSATLAGATAQPTAGTVAGVATATDGTPIRGAAVTLTGNGAVLTGTTDLAGRFRLAGVPPGTYAVVSTVARYTKLTGRTIDVRAGAATPVDLVLSRDSSSSLTTIGQVRANGGETLSSASAPSIDLNTQRYAAQGITRVSDVLTGALSTTVIRPLGGGANSPAVIALRGPDPSETLVDIDGHEVNNGNSGDFDVSLLDPADFQSVQIVYGIAPSSLIGPNTLGGAINIRTLEPTTTPHGFVRLSGGSYSSFAETLQATGTERRLGYALSLHRATSVGEVKDDAVSDAAGDQSSVGSALGASTFLAKLRYSFGRGDGFIGLAVRDQSVFRDLSAGLTSLVPSGAATSGYAISSGADTSDYATLPGRETSDAVPPVYNSLAGSALQAHNAGYGLDAQLPIGKPGADGIVPTTALYRHLTSLVSQSVVGPAADTSPYLYNDRDLVGDDTLQIDRQYRKATLTLKFGFRTERLDTDFMSGIATADSVARRPLNANGDAAPTTADASPHQAAAAPISLAQSQRSVVLRYSFEPTAKLHYTLGTYYSNFSTFGSHIDPRFGFVWTPTADSAVRASVGTTFQSPQLTALYVPATLPQPVNGYITVGNPGLRADYATEYDLGYEHLIGSSGRRTHFALDLYRTNLRAPAGTYLPATTCGSTSSLSRSEDDSGTAAPPCLSYPINVGGAVYRGIELRADRELGTHTALRATYGVDSAYLTSVPSYAQNGTLVIGEQTLGVPLHKATLTLERDADTGLAYYAGLAYEGRYNELNEPPFASLRAGVTWHLSGFDVGLYGTNLTNVYDDKFTRVGAGVSYGGLAGPLATDAYALTGRTITLSLTRRY